MGKQIKGLLYFFSADIRYSIMIFWTILLSVLIVSITISYFLLSVEDGVMGFGFPFAIYFYFIILGFLTVKESIPFALKMGATRKNIFLSIGIFFFVLAFVKALVANTLQTITQFLTEKVGIHTFHFLHPAQLLEDTWLNRVIIDTSIMFFLSAFMFIIGLLFYKYGLAGGGTVAAILVLTLLVGIAQGWLFEWISNVFKDISLMQFYQMLVIGIVLYGISFILIRKVTIVKA
ncbi:hypothetical protein ACFSTA_03340 [Ornithinibacillus salinisoli]|uniref:ABC transporter permease n=1 Tax=Ornithinibacillus salinisoli TaxID=1848459 RepID=A0ABW4VUP9_9BACI